MFEKAFSYIWDAFSPADKMMIAAFGLALVGTAYIRHRSRKEAAPKPEGLANEHCQCSGSGGITGTAAGDDPEADAESKEKEIVMRSEPGRAVIDGAEVVARAMLSNDKVPGRVEISHKTGQGAKQKRNKHGRREQVAENPLAHHGVPQRAAI